LANGYAEKDIRRAIKPRVTPNDGTIEPENSTGTAYLPYLENVTDRISKVLRRKDIKTIFKLTRKLESSFGSVKDPMNPLSTPGIYSIPCECGKEYIGMTNRSVSTRLKEHERHLRLEGPKRLVKFHYDHGITAQKL